MAANIDIVIDNIAMGLLREVEYWGMTEKDAEKCMTYIAGVIDLADAIKRKIREQGALQ